MPLEDLNPLVTLEKRANEVVVSGQLRKIDPDRGSRPS
jgi:hypothetical protein